MRRTQCLLLLTVLLVGCAGCNGITDPSGVAGNSSATDAAAYPKNGTELNGTVLRQRHVESLLESQSFESYATVRVGDERAGTRVETVSLVNRSTDRALSVTRFTSVAEADDRRRTVTRYTVEDRTAEQVMITANGRTEIRNRTASAPYTETPVQGVNATQATGGRFVEFTVASIEWNRTSIGQLNGTPVTRYNAAGIDQPDRLATLLGGASNSSLVNATLAVDRDGVVRELTLRADAVFDGTPGSYQLVVRIRGVGNTSVTRPTWMTELDEWEAE